MPYVAQTRDLTKQYLQYDRKLNDYRPVANGFYPPGTSVSIVPLDQQTYPDQGTVSPTPLLQSVPFIVGVVADTFRGFDVAGNPPNYMASPNQVENIGGGPNARGTQGVLVCVRGVNSALVDQTEALAAPLSNGTMLRSSTTKPGYACATATLPTPTQAFNVVGAAMLPATLQGGGSTIPGNTPVVQASATLTLGTLPPAGSQVGVTMQMPYTMNAPGVVQTETFSMPYVGGSATLLLTNLTAYLNSQPDFARFYTATYAGGTAITISVNQFAAPFLFTTADPATGGLMGGYEIGLSGQIGNGLTMTGVPSTSFTVSGPFAGGTSFVGRIPALIQGADI